MLNQSICLDLIQRWKWPGPTLGLGVQDSRMNFQTICKPACSLKVSDNLSCQLLGHGTDILRHRWHQVCGACPAWGPGNEGAGRRSSHSCGLLATLSPMRHGHSLYKIVTSFHKPFQQWGISSAMICSRGVCVRHCASHDLLTILRLVTGASHLSFINQYWGIRIMLTLDQIQWDSLQETEAMFFCNNPSTWLF